jgi:hypothetical protein
MDTGYQYCPSVPYRPDLVFCYPKVVLQTPDILAVGLCLLLIGIALTLYVKGRAK